MPIDKPEATATDHPRRAFLARAAVGGALATVGSIAGPLLGTLPAGAQTPAEIGDLDDSAYAAWLGPLELAAIQVYGAALDVSGLGADVTGALRAFQAHHQTVSDTVGALYVGTTPLTEDPPTLESASQIGNDTASVLASLISLEEALAATHLSALAGISDPVTAKLAAQILAVEGQQAVALGFLAKSDLTELVPARASTEGARPAGTSSAATTSTTTSTTTGKAGN